MSCILHIETSTDACSVAVSEDGQLIYHDEHLEGPSHSIVLGGMVSSAMSFADSHAIPFDAVSVSIGPGSYTGLRIGLSMAKGLCYGRDLKLLSIPTLEILCVPVLLGPSDLPDDALLCPMIDARRMEVYCSVFTRSLSPLLAAIPIVVDENSFDEFLSAHPVYFFGNGSDKCKPIVQHPNAHFIDGIRPLAKNMMPLAEKLHAQCDFTDLAYSEPFYLKEFQAVKSKKTI